MPFNKRFPPLGTPYSKATEVASKRELGQWCSSADCRCYSGGILNYTFIKDSVPGIAAEATIPADAAKANADKNQGA